MNKKTYANKTSIPGIIVNNDSSITFNSQLVPASEHFFKSNCFSVNVDGPELILLFGHKSIHSKSESLDAAAEIHFPIPEAKSFLYEAIWVTLGSNNMIFADSIKISLEKSNYFKYDPRKGFLKDSSFSLPNNTDTYRAFASNNASMSFANSQCMIEFFEASPNLVANLAQKKVVKERDGLKPVIAILVSQDIFLNIFEEIKNILNTFELEIGE